MSRLGILVCLVLACLGCSDRKSPTSSPTPRAERVASTQGGAIVLSRDERIAVATNRTAGVVTIIHLDPTKAPSDLVVDASGRGSRTPQWLRALGVPAPEESRVDIRLGYASRLFRRRRSLQLS